MVSILLFQYGSPLGLELEHKIKIEHDHHQIKSCSNSNTIGSPLGLEFEHNVYYIFVNGYLGLVVSR